MSHARSILGLVPSLTNFCLHIIDIIIIYFYHFSQSSVPIMALGGQFRVWPVEIGDGPRLVKLPPLLAPSKISYSKISKCISTKVYIFLAILYLAIKYFRLAL